MTIGVGAPAPDFTLPATSAEPVSLAALRERGPVLLAFFPLAFTSTCTAELCAFRDDFDQFASRGVTVVPISVDAVPSLREYKARHAMRTDLASDFRRDVSRAYGVLNEDRYYANRSYFLIDRSGVIRWAHVERINGERRENADLLAAIDSCQP